MGRRRYYNLFYSEDFGVTWRSKELTDIYTKYPDYPEPKLMAVMGDLSGHFFIVALSDDKAVVYQARKNSMTWKEEQSYYGPGEVKK